MSVKNCEKLEKSMVALTVEVGAADFEAAVEKAYKKQRGQIRVPGFRPGKAPRKMIEAMFGAQVFYEEAVNIALPDAYEEAVKEQELQVVGYPQVELLDVGKEGFSFKATVAVFPEMTLGQYKGLEAPRAEAKVTDEDVDAEYEKMAKQYGMEAEEIKKYMDAEVIREQVLRDKAIRVVVDSAVAVEPVIQAEEPAQAPAEEAPAEEKPKAKRTRKKKTAEEPAEASESAPEAAE